MEKLKPCPFCGFIGLEYHYCPNCGAKMKMKHKYCDVVNGCVMCDVELCNGKERTMSKLIVEMEMPKACRWDEDGKTKRCPIAEWGGACAVTKLFEPFYDNRPSWCPIVGVLPEEHGDLIDRDIMYKEIELWKSTATDTITMGFLYHIEKLLMSIRPAIAAERKDDGK